MADNTLNNQPVAAGPRKEDEQSFQLNDLLALVWDHKWWYVFSILAALLIAGFYLYKTPKTYSRTEKVIVDEDAQASMMRDLTSFSGSGRRYGSGTNVNNEIEALRAPDIMEKVVARLGLETSYVDNQFLRVREMYTNCPIKMQLAGMNVSSAFSFDISKGKDSTFVISDFKVGEDVVKGFKVSAHVRDTVETPIGNIIIFPTKYFSKWDNEITVSWVKPARMAKRYVSRLSAGLSNRQGSVVVLTMQDVFPSRAETVLSTLLDIYKEDWVENKNQSVTNTSKFIDERLVVIERELGGIEEDLKDYKQSHNLTNINQVGSAICSNPAHIPIRLSRPPTSWRSPR